MSIDTTPAVGRVRVRYHQVPSTMDVAMALGAAGAPHGTLVEAGEQTAGRGRHGRRWDAPAGSAFLGSWLLRAPARMDLAALSPAVAAAVVRTIEALAPEAPVAYKWPNDVLIGGRKVAGILLAARATTTGALIVAGTGINVLPASVPPGIPATCLAHWTAAAIADVRERLATELDAVWGAALAADGLPEGERRLLEARMAGRGKRVEVVLPDGPVTGIAAGLAAGGGLRLASGDGRAERVLMVGEIVRGPRGVTGSGAESTVYFSEQGRC